MKPTSFSTLVLFTIILSVSVNALLLDTSELERFPPQCRSILRIEILGFGRDALLTEARLTCEESCDDGIEKFKISRCPELCGRRRRRIALAANFERPEVCNLCSNGADTEIKRCRNRADSGLKRCKQGCKNNKADFRSGFYQVTSTSGSIRLVFPSKITK